MTPAEEVLPDDLDLERDEADEADELDEPVPTPRFGLTAVLGVVHAELPAAAHLGLSLGIRPAPGLRLELTAESWAGRAYLPRTDRVVPVGVPSLGAALLYEAPTRGPARPWVGAGASGALVLSRPVVVGPVLAGRAGLDVGRGAFAWTLAASAGVLVAPSLPGLAGPTYRAVAPVLSLSTGPSFRL
jgi:hypothetical protein